MTLSFRVIGRISVTAEVRLRDGGTAKVTVYSRWRVGIGARSGGYSRGNGELLAAGVLTTVSAVMRLGTPVAVHCK